MARKRTLKLHCPTCKTVVTGKGPEFPFCSERCRTIDLGKWASGGYVIRSPVRDISNDELSDRKSDDLTEE
ncbi:MAG: DNA gyrase inhibitor YacG [Terriglobales bacterium]